MNTKICAHISLLGLLLLASCGSDKAGTGGSGGSGGTTTATGCAKFTDSTACTKTDAVKGKTCLWEFNECQELTELLKSFRGADQNFKVALPVGAHDLAKDAALGVDHSETPDWNAICGIGGAPRHNLSTAVTSISLSFKKDKKEVAVLLDCTKGGGGQKTYNFGYEAKTIVDKKTNISSGTAEFALLLKLDAKANNVDGEFEAGRKGNVLDFFSKADWLFSKKDNAILGISQLGNLGYRKGSPLKELKDHENFEIAIAYARGAGQGYEIAKENGKDIGAISFIFSKN